jgi:hypothetical protein
MHKILVKFYYFYLYLSSRFKPYLAELSNLKRSLRIFTLTVASQRAYISPTELHEGLCLVFFEGKEGWKLADGVEVGYGYGHTSIFMKWRTRPNMDKRGPR